jgi:hypothetical protein
MNDRVTLRARAPFAMTLLIGLVLGATVLIGSQLGAMRAADGLVTVTEPLLTDASLERLRADLDEATAVAVALEGPGLSRLAALSRRDRAEFDADVERAVPAYAAAAARLPEAGALADAVVGNLERRQAQFAAAAELPGLGLTLRDAVWLQLVLAGVFCAVGVLGLRRPDARLAAIPLAVGALMVVVPLALGQPGKARDTDAVLDSLRPFSTEKVEVRRAALADATTVFEALRGEVVPRVAAIAGMTPAEVLAALEDASGDLSAPRLERTAVILDRFGGLVDFSARIQPLLVRSDGISARAGTWLIVVPGAVLVLVGASGLLIARRRVAD